MNAPLTLAGPGAFAPGIRALAERHAQRGGARFAVAFGPATGAAEGSVTSRLASDAPPDVAFLPAALMDRQIAGGTLLAAGRVEVGASLVALCVQTGAPRPDIATPEALQTALRAAPSIGISALGSGVFFRDELLARLGMVDEIGPRCQVVTDGPVGQAVAQGAVALGVQQWAELLQEDGIDVLGPLPLSLQGATMIAAAASPAAATRPEVVEFLDFLSTAEAAECLRRHGLVPATAAAEN